MQHKAVAATWGDGVGGFGRGGSNPPETPAQAGTDSNVGPTSCQTDCLASMWEDTGVTASVLPRQQLLSQHSLQAWPVLRWG